MVSGTEQKFKRSVKNLFQIWVLLCGAALLAFFLYFNRLTTHTALQYTGTEYVLYDRSCVELVPFRHTVQQAPLYYAAWFYGQKALDRLHERKPLSCEDVKAEKKPSSP